MLLSRVRKLSDDDLVFGTNEKFDNAESAEIVYLERLLKKLGLDDKYPNGRLKISTHSFRSYFITQVSRHDPNLAKYFAGQKGYLLQYDRHTDQQKLEYYLDFEADLLVYDLAKKDKKINQLQISLNAEKEQNEKTASLESDVKVLYLKNASLLETLSKLENDFGDENMNKFKEIYEKTLVKLHKLHNLQ